ncbi:MAG: hypothetical protein GWP10_00040 [Nitrospiraceae bacterium]|nr:hypothetical protein [Nitrospiraceae bacterium]
MTRTRGKNQKIQFQMGWGGLIGLAFASICVLLWVFVLGFWVGQKLVGRDQHELHPVPPITDTVTKSSPESAEISEKPGLPTENIREKGTAYLPQGPKKDIETRAKDGSAAKKDHATGRYFVLQIASYREKGQADREYRKWRDKGYHMQIKKVKLGANKGIWYRVYLGKFPSLKEAIASSEKLAKKYGMKSYVLPLGE